MATRPFRGAQRLRNLLADEPSKLICCPGVQDGLSARLANMVGFDALYMTGAGTSMSRLGWADLGLATLNDMHDNVSMIASLDPDVPVIADADTGYGGPNMVVRTVAKYARAGVAALHIEDQVQEKRCGHLMGKVLVDRETYYSKLRAAVAARNELESDMLIIARTDSRQSLGFDEAVERLQEAVRIGVDIVFLEAMQTRDECEKVVQIFKGVPVLLNMVPGGVTPWLTAAEARQMGFRIMIWPGATLEPIINSVTHELEKLKRDGSTTTTTASSPSSSSSSSSSSTAKHRKFGVKDAFDVCGLQECIAIDMRAGGKAYATVNDEERQQKK